MALNSLLELSDGLSEEERKGGNLKTVSPPIHNITVYCTAQIEDLALDVIHLHFTSNERTNRTNTLFPLQ